jgi:uncharacterized membrane protein YphA (DoxX/SURF4 family)
MPVTVERPLLTPPERVPSFDIVGWVLRVGVGAVFVMVGWTKFESHSMWVPIFDRIGVGSWFRYFTGVLQISGGLLMCVPKTVHAGALIAGITMVGAIAAHLFVLGTGVFGAVIPFALLVVVVAVAVRQRE